MDHSRIHLVVTKNQQGKVECHRNVESLNQSIKGKTLIAHNGIGFDFPVLNKLWNTKIRLNQVLDTLVLSRLMNPQRKHSLAAWGETLKFPKTDFKEFDEYSEEMQQYCINDVEVLEKVYQELEKERTDYGFSQECIILEHEVASIVSRQVSRSRCCLF